MKIIKFSAVMTVLLLVNIAFIQTGSAKSIIPSSEPNAADSELNNLDLDLTFKDQKLVIEAIRASDLTENEKKKLINNLRDIWSGKSDLSESEQIPELENAAYILYDYLRIHQSEVSAKWNWSPHADLARTAGLKMGVPSEYCQILYDEANTPDNWFRYPGDHFWYVSWKWGDGPSNTRKYADEARDYITSKKNQNPAEGYKRLGWSIHYMSDLANPWHTVVLYGQAYHTTYEDYVGENWYSGHCFNETIQNDWYYYEIIDPEASAKNLAAISNQYIEYLVGEIATDTNWRNDPTVVCDTRTVLTHAIRYDIGLIDYSTGKEGGKGK